MIEEIINWIDKDLSKVKLTELFIKYFEGRKIVQDEMDYYLSNEEKGIEIVISTVFEINTIHLFSKYENYMQFEDELPFNIEFSLTKVDIRSLLGEPSRTGGGTNALYIGFVYPWDKYYFDNYTMHFQYSIDELAISIITIGSLKLEEYFNSALQ